MTKKDFLEKYGNITVKFDHYYKYSFTYTATLDNGEVLSVTFGGCSDDIYRTEVSNNDEQTIISLDPYCGSVYKGDKQICVFYEFD